MKKKVQARAQWIMKQTKLQIFYLNFWGKFSSVRCESNEKMNNVLEKISLNALSDLLEEYYSIILREKKMPHIPYF